MLGRWGARRSWGRSWPRGGGVAATRSASRSRSHLVCGVASRVALWSWSHPRLALAVRNKPLAAVFAAVFEPRLATGLLLIGFSPLLFGMLTVLAPLTLSGFGWGAAAIGGVFLVAALFEAAVHPLLGRWSDRAGYRPPVVAGLLASLAVLISLPLAPAAPLVALLVVLAGGAFNAPLIPGTALLSRNAESAGIAGALAFGAANFAWAPARHRGFLGGALADLGGDALSTSL